MRSWKEERVRIWVCFWGRSTAGQRLVPNRRSPSICRGKPLSRVSEQDGKARPSVQHGEERPDRPKSHTGDHAKNRNRPSRNQPLGAHQTAHSRLMPGGVLHGGQCWEVPFDGEAGFS